MNEQRLQAYQAFLKTLLECPEGEESEILQQNIELLDAELLEVMEQHAESLMNQGQDVLAEYLLDLAEQLRQAMVSGENSSLEESTQFLWEMLQLVAENGGDPQKIYPVWAIHQENLNEQMLKVLPDLAEQLLSEDLEQHFVAAVLGEFGNLIHQFPQGIRWLNLELAISAYQQTLQIYSKEAFPEDWATTQNNLAAAYGIRVRGNRAENLELAIATYQSALEVYNRETFPQDWAMTQSNLASAYRNRIRGDRAENIELAIAAYQSALEVYNRETFPQDWAITQNNLANAYSNRIRGDRAENIEQAIAIYSCALEIQTYETFPLDWAMTQSNLANAYSNRVRGDRATNLEQAITAYQDVLQIYTREAFPQDWAMIQSNLATAYRNRIYGERVENLEKAITAYKHALEIRTYEAFPQDWAITQSNLAATYSDRIQGDPAENLEQAIACYQCALKVLTPEAFPQNWAMVQNNMATAYGDRIKGDKAENLEQAIRAYEQALKIYTHEAFPNDCRRVARNLGNLYFEQADWVKAAEAYTLSLRAAEVLYQSTILLGSKAAELAAIIDLPRLTAYALLKSGQLESSVLTLEQGRARSLSESLQRDRSDLTYLERTHPELYERYQSITNQLRNLEAQERQQLTSSERHSPTSEVLRNAATQLHRHLAEIIVQICQIPGYEDFLSQPTFADIQRTLHQGYPLIYLAYTPVGSFALVVALDSIIPLLLDDFTEADLRELLYGTIGNSESSGWFNALEALNHTPTTSYSMWLDVIDEGSRQLWQTVMEPLVHCLKRRQFQRAMLIPTGLLSLLPLHAAWTKDLTTHTGKRYAIDEINFTYAPNARSLQSAQEIAQHTLMNSILTIDNPTQDQNLTNSTREVNAAVSTFPRRTTLRHDEATFSAVLNALPNYSVLHFSCHGTANLAEPLNSGLLMSDRLLTLRDIFALNLAEHGGIRLTILSACETGLPGIELVDEAVSLPTGLLQAGVAGIVASLWAVNDRSTMMLLVKFYDLWRNQRLDPSVALRQAQQWLRDSTDGEKTAYFKGFYTLTPNERKYAHPYYWGAFSYVGV